MAKMYELHMILYVEEQSDVDKTTIELLAGAAIGNYPYRFVKTEEVKDGVTLTILEAHFTNLRKKMQDP